MPNGLVGSIYTQFKGVMENPYFEKLADFSHVHVDMKWIGPMWPKCTFGDQKELIWKKKTCRLAIPLVMRQKIASFSKNIEFYFFTFDGSKSGVLGQKTVLKGVLDRVWGSGPETKTRNNHNGP